MVYHKDGIISLINELFYWSITQKISTLVRVAVNVLTCYLPWSSQHVTVLILYIVKRLLQSNTSLLQFGFRAIFLTHLCPSTHLRLHHFFFFFAINPIASLWPTYSLPCQMSIILTTTINFTGNLTCFSIIKVKILLVSNASPMALLIGTKALVKGYHQQLCLDYSNTFNLVVQPTIVHIVLSIFYLK